MHQFKVLIERDEEGYFIASVPALSGCSTQAKTLTHVMERIREAIQLCLEVSKTNQRYQSRVRQFAYEPTFVGMDVVTI